MIIRISGRIFLYGLCLHVPNIPIPIIIMMPLQKVRRYINQVDPIIRTAVRLK